MFRQYKTHQAQRSHVRASAVADRPLPFLRALCIAAVLISVLNAPSATGDKINQLVGDPKVIEQGRTLFKLYCSGCHGLRGEGGRGPDLSSSRLGYRGSDEAIFRTIAYGIAGTPMRGFDKDMTEDEIWKVAAFIRTLSGPSGTQPLEGNRDQGEKIFWGKGQCGQCHMVSGRGGRLGPELTRIGAQRSTEHIRESILRPSADITSGYKSVTVVTNRGERITGIKRNEDNFTIQIMDMKENFRFFFKEELKQIAPEEKSLMFDIYDQLLSPDELQDLLAYLDSLRGK